MADTARVKHAKRPISSKAHSIEKSDFGAALGASHSFAVTAKPKGPFGVAALLDEIQVRLVSRGGRPSDLGPTIRRLVPIKKQVWRSLKAQAAFLSSQGKRISPAQLAAMLVEKSVSEFEDSRRGDRKQTELSIT